MAALSTAITAQDRALAALERLQGARDNIFAHAGSWSTTIENRFFDPVNQYWLSTSESVLTADHALADALGNEVDPWDVVGARFDVVAVAYQLVGVTYSSLPIIYFSDFLELIGVCRRIDGIVVARRHRRRRIARARFAAPECG